MLVMNHTSHHERRVSYVKTKVHQVYVASNLQASASKARVLRHPRPVTHAHLSTTTP